MASKTFDVSMIAGFDAEDGVSLLCGLIDTSMDAVIAIDSESKVFGWNKATEALFGYSTEEAMGQPLDKLIIPPEQRAAHNHGMKFYLRTGVGPILGKRLEVTALNKANVRFPVELAVGRFAYKGREYFVARVRNISERKENETKLLQLAESRLKMANKGKFTVEEALSREAKDEALRIVLDAIAKAQAVLDAFIMPGHTLTAAEAAEKVHKLLGVLDNPSLKLAQGFMR